MAICPNCKEEICEVTVSYAEPYWERYSLNENELEISDWSDQSMAYAVYQCPECDGTLPISSKEDLFLFLKG